jgi:carbonic anhydrase
MHLVHKNHEEKLLVIGVLAQECEVYKELALAGAFQFDVMMVLPKDRAHFYAYEGSLTPFPCTVGVLDLKEFSELSGDQIYRFIRAYGPIARSVQLPPDREIQAQTQLQQKRSEVALWRVSVREVRCRSISRTEGRLTSHPRSP